MIARTKICPIRCIRGGSDPAIMPDCLEDRCAWWEYLAGSCCIAAGTCGLQDMVASLDDLALNYQARGNLQQKSLPGAANTEQAKGGTDLADPDSISTIPENGGNVK